MCGIFAYISKDDIDESKYKDIVKEGLKCQHRGPDNTKYRMENDHIFLQFHRLCINDLSSNGDQPLTHPDDFNTVLICNGEIYNHMDLSKKFNITTHSKSDCEIILHLYKKIGFKETIKELDGVFACVLVDLNNNTLYAARDRIGVRSMYFGENNNFNNYGFSSELKSLHTLFKNIEQFPPGKIWDSETKNFQTYFEPSMYIPKTLGKEKNTDLEPILYNIKHLFEKAVKKRLMSDRNIGCLLSGGFDSSIVAAILSKQIFPKKLNTFSIGLYGSPDLKYAKIVSDHIGSIHHEIIVSEKDMLDFLEEDIRVIETYDTTTIRASTPMLLLSNYIKKNTDIVVIYSGEGSDEASGSYLYFHNAPTYIEFAKETRRLLKDLSYFDVLRCDKSTAGAGLEVRVPFLDQDFMKYYMEINPYLKMPKTFPIEKYLLRKSFDDSNLLPKEVLWRVKEGMSDGVSSETRGWYEIIQDHINEMYTDEEFNILKSKYTWNPPLFKEALYFREIFNKYYPGRDKTIPYYWLPKWSGDISEPSARVLNGVYPSNKKDEFINQQNI
jgi:asparagine synthase (glutamine-hydrolysing)